MIENLFETGHAADIVLGVLAMEAVWLKTRGWRPLRILTLIGPAICIVAGLRAALIGADWWWVALPLAASLPLHLIDLRFRMRDRI